MPTIEELLKGSGGKSASFKQIGDSHEGVVTRATVGVVSKFGDPDRTPEVWKDGSPKLQVIIGVQTPHKDDADDDGVRNIYIKWWGESAAEFTRAVKAAGDTDARVGGWFKATYVGDKPAETAGLNPTKLFRYEYRMAGVNPATLAPPAQPAGYPPPAAPMANPVAAQTPAAPAAAFVPVTPPPAPPAVTPPPAPPAPAVDPAVALGQIKDHMRVGWSDEQLAQHDPLKLGLPVDTYRTIRATGL